MTAVRLIGIVAAIWVFTVAVRAHARRRISRLSLLIVSALALVVAVLSLAGVCLWVTAKT